MTESRILRRYPSITLEKAITRIQPVFAIEKRTPAAITVIADHLGFSSPSTGPASTTISALKQYGLLEDRGSGHDRQGVVTELAWVILAAPEESERRSAIRSAALMPRVMKTIQNQYPDGIGSQAAFRWYLERDLGFSSKGADEFSRIYVANVRFAQLNSPRNEDASDGAPEQSADPDEDTNSGARISPNSSSPQVAPGRLRSPEGIGAETGTTRHAIPLIGGKQVVLEGDFPLSEQAWEGFLNVLQAFKPGLVKSDND